MHTNTLAGMAYIPGGVFTMGSDAHYPEEKPAHKVRVDPFWIDRYTVTNRDFARFVAETGHVTLAEKPANPDDYPGADPALLAPASVVLVPPPGRVDLRNHYNWWQYIQGADWRHPRGPDTSIRGLDDHPVVQVAYSDALAYARWIGKDLPTEAEWEFAAKGGLEGTEYAWGDELVPDGRYMANTWQGEFPWQNQTLDGYDWTAPVGSFPANGYDLYDMIGNVWEWTSDWYQDHGRIQHACCTLENPRGAEREASVDARNPGISIPRRVMKGGSHACAPNYCRRYRPAARMAQPVDTSTCHVGFRCIVREARGTGS
ncbi:formylglycine-generating enzyme family protein [Luteimonas kalidii]|uniref:Formylglycine-generating enzyme family protein n=1 Tax=Luteimonas kalidii TaxID=3042025 RepID=A0ABT6JSA8_9GAMM|nr:formylglycine-generating enzyme family protein [Luteimonas kalidii]MDH5833574.1 formylglycine-generating enzyme family protein [Luteimonas kalidii]